MAETARRTAVATIVVVAIAVLALALWKLRLVLGLLFLSIIIASAIRPSIEWLARHHVPRAIGLLAHYAVLIGIVAAALSFAVPRALDQVDTALSPRGQAQIAQAARQSSGVKHQILTELQKRLHNLPKANKLVGPATQIGVKAFEVIVGILFTFAAAAYWIFERDRTVDLVASLLPRPQRKKLRDTWDLIDAKLGAFVRGQTLLVVAVGTVLSIAYWAIGEPYWLLVGAFAGIVEIIPVIGPLVAAAVAIGVGLTASVHVAILAGVCLLAVRLAEDYLVMPRVLGDATGLSPLLVLVAVTIVTILFSAWAVLFAVPIAAVCATIFDVVLRGVDPAEEDPPTVIFSARETEA